MAKSIIHAAGAKHGSMPPNETGRGLAGAAEKEHAKTGATVPKIHATHKRHGAKGMHLKHSA